MTQSYKQLLVQLAPTSTDAQLDQPTENKNRFEKLLVWIDQNIDSPISLNDLLAQSGLSLLELNRQFKLHTKQSPLQFIKEFRKFKQEAALANQPIIDQTYALFDPFKK